jgi:hypothetical protein
VAALPSKAALWFDMKEAANWGSLGLAGMSWNESRRAIFEAAQDMLAGSLSYVEGARKIIAALATAKLDERDTDLVPFVGFKVGME